MTFLCAVRITQSPMALRPLEFRLARQVPAPAGTTRRRHFPSQQSTRFQPAHLGELRLIGGQRFAHADRVVRTAAFDGRLHLECSTAPFGVTLSGEMKLHSPA